MPRQGRSRRRRGPTASLYGAWRTAKIGHWDRRLNAAQWGNFKPLVLGEIHAAGNIFSVRSGMAALNERRVGARLEPLGYGIGVNVGDVMYGNIGTPTRLDFTVIGPAVNTAARLEGLSKSLDRTALFSGAFAGMVGSAWLRSLGRHPLRGLGEPVEVFGFADENFQC